MRCDKCGHQSDDQSIFCPRCGERLHRAGEAPSRSSVSSSAAAPLTHKGQLLLGAAIFVVLIGFVWLWMSGDSGRGSAASLEKPSAQGDKVITSRNWFTGGTLHKAGALEWQKASHANELATCGDFVTAAAQRGRLRAEIRTKLTGPDAVRPYAEQLVDFIDASFEPLADESQNERTYVNQTVGAFAVLGMASMGWAK